MTPWSEAAPAIMFSGHQPILKALFTTLVSFPGDVLAYLLRCFVLYLRAYVLLLLSFLGAFNLLMYLLKPNKEQHEKTN